jgi:hypothetical protein
MRGYHGQGLLSSLAQGDAGRGALVSPEFRLDGRVVSAMVGGGRRRKDVGVELIVGDRVIAAARGNDSNFMYPVLWDVSADLGKLARLRVFDESKSAHILIDHVLAWR